MSPVAAAVLAGGWSTRMGRDKALLPVPGAMGEELTLLERQWGILAVLEPCERLLSCRESQQLPCGPGVCPVFDDGSAGPLGGLVAVLRAMRAEAVFVLGVDLGCITEETVRSIAAAARAGGPAGLVACTGRGLEPLAGVYPRALLSVAEAQIAVGRDLSLRTLVRWAMAAGLMSCFDVPAQAEREFANWNRPEDVRS